VDLRERAPIRPRRLASGFRARVDSINAGHPEVDSALATSETFIELASAHGGFEFSEEAIECVIDRRVRFDNAWYFDYKGKDRAPRPDFDPDMDLAA
jgi:hypothetical protein